MTGQFTGIDLNGLCDVSVNDVRAGILRGGSVPSVCVVQPQESNEHRRDPVQVIAGEEAALAVEGRGWLWPESSHVTSAEQSQRIPLHHILEALGKDRDIHAAGIRLQPAELLASSIAALARPQVRESVAGRSAVIAVPDNGEFLEEARQQLIDAAVQGGLTPTLLWRSVAALLAIETHLREDDVPRLADKTVGVLSCLEDGVHVQRLDVEVIPDARGSYFVPIRREPGKIFPYQESIYALAVKLAKQNAPPDDPQDGWQLLWGNGLVLSWLLHLTANDTVVQRTDGWQLISGKAPADLPQIDFDDAVLDQLAEFLYGVDYTVCEGPAFEAYCRGTRLGYFLREKQPPTARSLKDATRDSYFAARGCVIYQQRKAADRITYYDHLPQLRLAVSRSGGDPDFLDLIDPQARVEGGEPYAVVRDLGLSIMPGTPALNFYLLREGNAKPRHVNVKLPERVSTAVPIRLRIRQQPAQGTARLTLEAAQEGGHFRPVELHWEHMEEQDLSEEEVLERLKEKPVDVPPVQPQPCHPLLWTAQLSSVGGSLEQLLLQLADILDVDQPSSADLLPLMDRASKLLTRRSSPAILTRRRSRDWKLYRAVSSDGAVPDPSNGLSPILLEQFEFCLKRLGEIITSEAGTNETLCSAITRLGGWCFLRCPSEIRRHLIDVAESGDVPDVQIYFRSMGKVFASTEDCQALFGLLQTRLSGQGAKFMLYEIEGLFYLLSIREDAPLALSNQQATIFANKLLDRIDERVRAQEPLSRLVNASLKAYAGLMRFRIVRPDYMTPQDSDLGEKQGRVLSSLLRRARRQDRYRKITELTKSLIEWSEKRGADHTILQWDPEDG